MIGVQGRKTVAQESPPPFYWTLDRYDRLVQQGFFDGERVELIDGEILTISPINEPHEVGTGLTQAALAAAFGTGFWVRVQMSLYLSNHFAPEPDLAVVPGGPRDYLLRKPRTALLVAEVSDATLAYDRGRKARLYAAAGIEDYWIVNLAHGRLEVHRRPVTDVTQPEGFRHDDVKTLAPGDVVSPLAAPHATIAVADLLP